MNKVPQDIINVSADTVSLGCKRLRHTAGPCGCTKRGGEKAAIMQMPDPMAQPYTCLPPTCLGNAIYSPDWRAARFNATGKRTLETHLKPNMFNIWVKI